MSKDTYSADHSPILQKGDPLPEVDFSSLFDRASGMQGIGEESDYRKLGDILLSAGRLESHELSAALAEQEESGKRLGDILVGMGKINDNELAFILARQAKVEVVDFNSVEIDFAIAQKLGETKSRQYKALPIQSIDDKYIVVAMADPNNAFLINELEQKLDRSVIVKVAGETALMRAIEEVFRGHQINSLVSEMVSERPATDFDISALTQDPEVQDAPVVKLLQAIFEEAVLHQASDIHIEPFATGIIYRLRVDGKLHPRLIDDLSVHSNLVRRLKIMSKLNISQTRLPQDGRFSIAISGHHFDVRLSFLPSEYGESVVMRLLDQETALKELTELGFTKRLEDRVFDLVKHPQGLVLVTGPTGSGKTTTLYSILNTLNTADRKIITVEDPVEYHMFRIIQVAIDEGAGLSFPVALKAMLRQDPDVVLVGEMRDQETASIGVRAAMTGHLVLSTLHTNDAVSTVTRLMDMGVQSYMLASCLKGIIAQRLVRRLCPHCKTPYTPDQQELMWLKRALDNDTDGEGLYKANGCDECNNTGFNGRLPIYEVLTPSKKAIEHLHHGHLLEFAKTAESQDDFISLAQSGATLSLKGETALEDVLKVAGDALYDEGRWERLLTNQD